ncbi:MAG: SDR family NAD(P)-dependent oxidoreductase [Chloroflexi bacterium]|nr:SDR family NAD(P)-dependent oxidoreductase [Chloroflexota bacterium]
MATKPNSVSSRGAQSFPGGGEPIAIVGMACRFPGAPDLGSFWRLLVEGKNSVTEADPNSGVGRMGELFGDSQVNNQACRFGAFVDDLDLFDASFFRISPVEAELLDPQQRMMLEVSWQALEDAGIDPARLRGSRTGVYTGISNDEYRMLVVDSSKPSEAAACLYALSGTNLNGTSGRVSFVLGLMGPAKAVDAACASSLVSVHDAVADLQQGKADLAIAGGVQAILNGRIYELRADSMMLSPDGQCKAFDASANGYVRGEGCGVVILKRLSEAEADGDRIWAVIRGAAVNHGGTGVGLTVPNTPGLEQVMEAALADAGIEPLEVDYIEAHGTGTTVGDPIELNAVNAVYGQGRNPSEPLLVASVKTNVGHLESAAGIAGLMKAALVVNQGLIPRHLHFLDPNPSLDWEGLPLLVPTETVDWPDDRQRPRLVGVNSFGISGTNSHILVGQHIYDGQGTDHKISTLGPASTVKIKLPETFSQESPSNEEVFPRPKRVLPLSGKSGGALQELAQRYLAWLDDDSPDQLKDGLALLEKLSDMAWTASIGRSHFDYRSGLVYQDVPALREGLKALAETGQTGQTGQPPRAARVAFLYTGQGSQWVGMGQALYETEPVARAVMDDCDRIVMEVRGVSLLDVMFGRDETAGDLGDTAWEQPALYALECALTALWESVGVRPGAVMGHSVGELAAAQAAGVFSLRDGMRFALARGSLLSATEAGAMAAVFAPKSRVAEAVERVNAASGSVGLSVSADNGPQQVVSGPAADIEAVSRLFESEGIRAIRLNTSWGFHSALLDPALDGLEAALDGVPIQHPSIPLVSNLTGRQVEASMAMDGAYWRQHARQQVAFAGGIGTLAEMGMDLVIELGPHSVLGPMSMQAWPESAGERRLEGGPIALASLRRPPRDGSTPEPESSFIDAVAQAYEAGLDITFEGLFAGEERRRISLPGYPFQRERYWLQGARRRRSGGGHPLLGERHDSARGEIAFETEVFPSDPDWLKDHRVFGHLVAPGALYGAMAATASLLEGDCPVVLDDIQLHSPLVFTEPDSGEAPGAGGRKLQAFLEDSGEGSERLVQIFSRGPESGWTMHVEGRVVSNAALQDAEERADLDGLKSRLAPANVPAYYRAKAATSIDLGPAFRTLGRVWTGPGEALGEVSLPEALGLNDLEINPLVLDGCFQVVGMARNMTGSPDEPTYLPFGWERMWLTGKLPDRVVCHVLMSESGRVSDPDADDHPEALSGEIRIYDLDGALIGGLSGYTVKRATQAALLAAVEGAEGIDDLLYEVIWRDRPLESALKPAGFFPAPTTVAAGTRLFPDYLVEAGVDPKDRNALLADLERWSHSYALLTLEKLGWQRAQGEKVVAEELRQRLNVLPVHERLFRRLLEMLARSGVVEENDGGFTVLVGDGDTLPESLPSDPVNFDQQMLARYSHGLTEIGLFRRSAAALVDVLRGEQDPLTLLFSSGEPTAADLYLKAPVARAANGLLADTVRALLADLPDDRRLRVLEVGAGTGSATASVLPELPAGRFDYVYTDISAGFFAEAEERFGNQGIEYRPLDIEKDPVSQGFNSHGYDLIIASNVLHATQYLSETLGHCRDLLAPSGQLVALENLRGLGWMDLTFGQLDGWWRFADSYRPHHALATPAIWRQALTESGFEDATVLGVDDSFPYESLDKGVIVAQGPALVKEAQGLWVILGDREGEAGELAAELAARNQAILLAGVKEVTTGAEEPCVTEESRIQGVQEVAIDPASREDWQSILRELPGDVPFGGVVHLQSLDGHGNRSTARELDEDVSHAGESALVLVQGLLDTDVTPEKGVWFVTRGAQVLERENTGELSGSVLWGLGKAIALEAPHLQPRMLDLDPSSPTTASDLAGELLYPDEENHLAYRLGRRRAARLVRFAAGAEESGRLALPEETEWVLAPDRGGVFDQPEVKLLPSQPLEPREVRVAVEAAGINFWDVFRSLGFIEEGDLGREFCGYVMAVGSDVSNASVGDHVVGLGFGAFAPEMVTHEELVAPAPEEIPVSGLATIPSAFVSADLSYRMSGLKAGDRVLIHAGAGGVGLAAIQLAQAAGAEVYATASAPKQEYLRSLGVKHIFDSRQTRFGQEILETTGGEGVDVVLNSLTSEGFIDASLSCLARGGRFVELARRDILSHEEMAAVRPDVSYSILELDVLKKTEPDNVGVVLREIMRRVAGGELEPLIHSRWPMAQAGSALSFMRSARHIGKIVLTNQPLVRGSLRQDRSYLITGGLGGIGCAVAGWLADHGAGTIVLNGRRDPDPEAVMAIEELRQKGARVEVELADVTDTAAIDAMLARIDTNLPPLAGVIHSVGVLSDAALTNQTWETFQQVLRPKIMGAWHLHRATMQRDLDLFVLFSSRVGVMGNPGQANHAAANAFLDQLAGHRRALGLPGQAMAWGAWSEIGEAAEQRERIERRRSALGGRWFTPRQGLRALEKLVCQDTTTSVVMSMDWSVFEDAVESRPSFLEDLLTSGGGQETTDAGTSEDLLSQLRGVPSAAPQDLLTTFLQQQVQAVLRLSSAPSPTVGFFDLGMDSLMAVELRNRLNRAFAGQYTASNTVVFDYPDIASLSRHLAEELGQAQESGNAPELAEPAAQEPGQAATTADDGIAVVGMACRFPGAGNLDEFWKLLEEGREAITDGRQDGGSWTGAVGDPNAEDIAHRRGGFLDGIDQFDSRFFRIQPIEARMMDPRQRVLLETTWTALEDAGLDPDQLRGSRTGIYAGLGGSEYRDLIQSGDQTHTYLGTTGSVTVGRIAFALGLEGPAMPVDMACASSLAAVHQAVVALQRGEVDMALAGGANMVLSPAVSRFMMDVGMLSPTGQCRPFDASANGYVRGEGCGIVVLKRLSDAEADGDRIWAVVRGSAVNQNGASAGLTVPNGQAQVRVMEDAVTRAGISPSEVDYLEAHAVGSQLGDPIELNAVASVYGKDREQEKPLLIGSIKSNIGHVEWAAGISAFIKAVLSISNGVIPGIPSLEKLNPNVAWDQTSLRVTANKMDWPAATGRQPMAGVSAFGLSGANAHVLVEGYSGAAYSPAVTDGAALPAGLPKPVSANLPDPLGGLQNLDKNSPERTGRLLPISGKSPGALRELAERYLNWLDARHLSADSEDLADLAWTASAGRAHFPHRAGLVFNSQDQLRQELMSLSQAESVTGGSTPRESARVAFLFAGQESPWDGLGADLCQEEPVARAVLDQCGEQFRAARGVSLLDVMFGRSVIDPGENGPEWELPARYALQCALTAQWASLGIRPSAIVADGFGWLAAAQAAGVCGLEDGLRFAAALGDIKNLQPGQDLASAQRDLEDALAALNPGLSSVPLVDCSSGLRQDTVGMAEITRWLQQGQESIDYTGCANFLADLEVNAVIEVGSTSATGKKIGSNWPDTSEAPLVVADMTNSTDGSGSGDSDGGFLRAAASLYEAGVDITFEGLFAGETRRRISVPTYPFQRRRYWF